MSKANLTTTAICLAALAVFASAASDLLVKDSPKPSLHAMTAHGTERKTMVTVPLDGAMEAVIALDHVTCDLTGYVLDRFTGQFFIQYRYNVARDFSLTQGKLPKFIMVAGQADFQQFTGNERVADGVIYVSEESSGQLVAYGLPWNTQFRASTTGPQKRPFVRLDYAKTRFIDISAEQ